MQVELLSHRLDLVEAGAQHADPGEAAAVVGTGP
jgi:hypothetical protein